MSQTDAPMQAQTAPTVVFAGAGPGAVDLITVRGQRALETADLVVYAGSLVNPEILNYCRPDCRLEDSSHLDLEAQVALMVEAAKAGKKVVRLHSGDPALYGAIREQMQLLAREGVEFCVIPGVTAGFAAAASLACEFTLPNVSQSLVFTRSKGRTPLPESQNPANFAKTGATLVFYLSSAHFDELTKELMEEGGLAPSTPCAIVSRVSWEDERILKGTLADIADQAQDAGISRQALLLVGEALGETHETKSLLYASHFSHGYRNSLESEAFEGAIGVFAFSPQGRIKAKEICQGLGGQARLYASSAQLAEAWRDCAGLIFVGATGLAVRLVTPLLQDKAKDPAVVSIDERGRFSVSLTGGHLGGANRLARRVARITAGQAVVSTATDCHGLVAFDEAAAREGASICNVDTILPLNRGLLQQKAIDFYGPADIHAKYWSQNEHVRLCQAEDTVADPARLSVCWDAPLPAGSENATCLQITSRNLVLGVGCHNGLEPQVLCEQARIFLSRHNIAPSQIACVTSLAAKGEEPSVQALVAELGCPFVGHESAALARVEGVVTTSSTVAKHMGTPSVSEAAALLSARTASGTATLTVPREVALGTMTFALARMGHSRAEQEAGSTQVSKHAPGYGGEIVVAGLGSGAADSITPEVRKALREADAIVGYSTYMDFVRPILEEEGLAKELVQSGMCGEMERCRKALELAASGKNVCLVCSGDPGLLAMAGLVLEIWAQDAQFAKVHVRVLPGVTAALLASAALGAPLQNGTVLISLSDLLVPADEVRANVRAALGTALPLALYNPAGKKRRTLLGETLAMARELRGEETWCAMVRHAGRPEQSSWVGQLKDLPEDKVDMSTLLIIGGRRTRYHEGYLFEERGYKDKYGQEFSRKSRKGAAAE